MPRLRRVQRVCRSPTIAFSRTPLPCSNESFNIGGGRNEMGMGGGAPVPPPALPSTLLGRQTHRCLGLHDRRGIPFTGERFRFWSIEPHGQVERSFRRRKPVGFLAVARVLVLEIEV